MNVSIERSHPKISEEVVSNVEKQMGNPFPKDYRDFILQWNGGHPQPNQFRIVWDDQDWRTFWEISSVDWFVSFHPGGVTDFLKYYRRYQNRIPAGLAPIAHDPGGSLILLGIEKPHHGKVFFWARDYEVPDGDEPDWNNVGFVADSFRQFLASLH